MDAVPANAELVDMQGQDASRVTECIPANTACIFVVECEGDGELVFAAKKMVRAMKTAELGGLQILTSPPYNDCIQQTILGH